jgi:hypothetical protein
MSSQYLPARGGLTILHKSHVLAFPGLLPRRPLPQHLPLLRTRRRESYTELVTYEAESSLAIPANAESKGLKGKTA